METIFFLQRKINDKNTDKCYLIFYYSLRKMSKLFLKKIIYEIVVLAPDRSFSFFFFFYFSIKSVSLRKVSPFQRAKMLEVPRSEFVRSWNGCSYVSSVASFAAARRASGVAYAPGWNLQAPPYRAFKWLCLLDFDIFFISPSPVVHIFFLLPLYCSSICSSDTPFSPLGSHPPTCHEKSDSTSYTQPVRDHQIVIVKYCISNDDNLELCVYLSWFSEDWQYWTAHIRSIAKENSSEGYKNIRNCLHARHRFFFSLFLHGKRIFSFWSCCF